MRTVNKRTGMNLPATGSPQPLSIRRICARPAALSLVGFSVLGNLLMLTGPLFMLQIYDRVLASDSVPTLVALTALAAIALATMAGLEATRGALLQRIAVQFEASHSPRVFASALWARLTGRKRSGQYLSDIETVRHFLNGQGVIAILDAPWAPLYLVLIFGFHPMLGIVATGGAVLLFALAWLNDRVASHVQRQGAATLSETQRFADAALQCAHAATAMGMAPSLGRRWMAMKLEALALTKQAGERTGLVQAASRAVRHGLQVAMLATGAILVIDKSITAGVMVAASIIMGRALSPVEQAIGHWRSFEAARSAWARLTELLRAVPPQRSAMPLPKPQGRLAVERVVCVPPGAREPVLKGISFDIRAGEALAIIGPSGAGKSSLAKVMAGIWQPTSGAVRIDGAMLEDYGAAARGSYLGYMPQEVELLDGTISENISRHEEDPDKAEVIRAAQQAGAHELILRFPDAYQTRIEDLGRSLSGGERQRIALARALYGKPSVVILDEPSSNLDRDGEIALMNALEALKETGVTSVLVAHRPSLLGHVDRVLVLDEGRIVAFGSRDEVTAKLFPTGTVHPLSVRAPEPRTIAG